MVLTLTPTPAPAPLGIADRLYHLACLLSQAGLDPWAIDVQRIARDAADLERDHRRATRALDEIVADAAEEARRAQPRFGNVIVHPRCLGADWTKPPGSA